MGLALALVMGLALTPNRAWAMHIAEGLLPGGWAMLWFALCAPLWVLGLREVRALGRRDPTRRALVGLVGAAVFVISCMPLPIPIVGVTSHPCGTGLAVLMLGPLLTVVITSVVLLLQALFLGHGGLTTLGAGVLAMGVVGGFAAQGADILARRCGLGWKSRAFLAGLVAHWATYATTALILALSFSSDGTGWSRLFGGLILGFAPTQVPLGLLEGALTLGLLRFVAARRPELVEHLMPTGRCSS